MTNTSGIIAGTYQIIERIGSGGGGVVYLAKHLRLDKKVVLKADKRKLSTRPEILRREVDTLKHLSHTYIPQVYDFFVDGETVYTVMDYIEGESLDKPLKRGERFSQAQVVLWAGQLLEAVAYLHSPTHGEPPRGIVHSDIKPANVMLTPQGNICLIDFNIALALGEENVVGRSAGYASPEHYGLDFSSDTDFGADATEVMNPADDTVAMSPSEYVSAGSNRGSLSFSTSSSKRLVVPDARSDIYSIGATLYHLLSGVKPAKNAVDVQPLSAGEYSPALVKIIARAMNPNPDLRYQTAEEMLADLRHLRDNDPRAVALRRANRLVCGALAAALLVGAGTAFVGLNGLRNEQQALTMAEYSANALQDGNAALAVAQAQTSLEKRQTAAGQAALVDALGIYDLTDGYKAHSQLDVPGEVQKLVASLDGRYVAVMTQGVVSVFAAEGKLLAELPAEESALADVAFAGDKLIYAGQVDGKPALVAYDIAAGEISWQGAGATAVAVSADGSTAAAIYKDEGKACVYDVISGKLTKTVDFSGKKQRVLANDGLVDPENNLLALSGSGRRLAVSFADGSLWVYDLQNSANDLIVLDKSAYTHFEGGFCGEQLAFAAAADGQAYFAVADTAKARLLGAFSGSVPYHTKADEGGIYVTNENLLVKLDANTGEQIELAYTDGDISDFVIGDTYNMVKIGGKTLAFYDKNARLLESVEWAENCNLVAMAGDKALAASNSAPRVQIWQLESHADSLLAKYPLDYSHSEARVSADGHTLMLFAFDGFRVYDMAGKMLADVQIPDGADVYDQQFHRDGGSYLEVVYNDGLRRCYSAADGKLISEQPGEKPDGSGYQEFCTDSWRICADVHGASQVYDIASGKLQGELQGEDYLAYATQTAGGVVVEYISAEGERYGLLLNDRLEVLARMPGLCDVWADGTLVFDDMRGNLRLSRIYSIDELLEMASIEGGGGAEA